MLLAAKLQTSFGEVDARLRDLSRKGALVECLQVPPVGSEVVFVRGATVVPARVAWAAGDRVGLEFDHMIDEQEVLVHIGKPAGRRPPAERYPPARASAPACRRDDRKIAKAWSVAVGLNLPESDGRGRAMDTFRRILVLSRPTSERPSSPAS